MLLCGSEWEGLWVRGGRGAAPTNGTASPIIRVYVLRVFGGDKEPPVAEDRFTWRGCTNE